MKYVSSFLIFTLSLLSACSQKTSNATKEKSANEETENSLLWKISGNGLTKPSYLFGTMHMLCAEDAKLSNNLKRQLPNATKFILKWTWII